MKINGQFILNPGTPQELILPNTMTLAGCLLFYRDLFRAEAVLAATLYVGLTNLGYSEITSLATLIVGEPVGHGYARQPAVRNTVDWTVSTVNGMAKVKSKNLVFTASSNWDKSWRRMFLCDVSAGSGGELLAVSNASPAAQVVTTGNGPTVAWEQWLRH